MILIGDEARCESGGNTLGALWIGACASVEGALQVGEPATTLVLDVDHMKTCRCVVTCVAHDPIPQPALSGAPAAERRIFLRWGGAKRVSAHIGATVTGIRDR